jgi:hypothetical protein
MRDTSEDIGLINVNIQGFSSAFNHIPEDHLHLIIDFKFSLIQNQFNVVETVLEYLMHHLLV